ncbi:hypothetical protein [Leptothoe kymatousa]|uniref:Uncharacterized protein n=1 Tax=Leptothoe kymatousa TAU-MAC 1615 TaxID=2364775 RepID=A0ABS5Y404_9CYAN|nr:hypothetical protein [Leptothoe kymatousa]MBT9312557.1 hypothetical protein [Leptothoe kymatousa TAU-MAC 1615]
MSNKANVNQTTVGPMGLPITQAIEVDSNRLSIYSESSFRWANALAIPSRGPYVDCLLWILTIATPARLLDSLVIAGLFPPLLSLAIGALLVAVPLVLTWQVWNSKRHLRVAILYRVLLLGVGIAIAFYGVRF